MEISEIIPHIEALVFASDKALNANDITDLINNAFGFLEERISLDQVESALKGIEEKYATEFYPFELKQSGGGWQFLTKADFHKTIAQLNGDKFLKRLSTAALESLAIIAYKQPITKGEVEAIRGVNSDYSIQKLLEKELIIISGRNEHMPGKPLVYSTSKTFMDYFGINTQADLPQIKEVLAEQIVEATIIKPEDFTDNSVYEQTASAEDSFEQNAEQEALIDTLDDTEVSTDSLDAPENSDDQENTDTPDHTEEH